MGRWRGRGRTLQADDNPGMAKTPSLVIPSGAPLPSRDLSDAEFAELDDLLAATPEPLEPLDVVMLDGYLCGLLVQPVIGHLSDRTWHLIKASTNEEYGPLDHETLLQFASEAKISPMDKLSDDGRQSWRRAPMIRELQMDWLMFDLAALSQMLIRPSWLAHRTSTWLA